MVLKNQRNFITNYFSENTKILQMDDDVKGIFEIINKENPNNYKKVNQYRKHNKLIPIKNLNLFITNAFIHCQKMEYTCGEYIRSPIHILCILLNRKI